jgi:Nuclease-related domain
MRLRYSGTCAVCAVGLPPGSEAEWNSERKTATCIACLDLPSAVSSGVAGASARGMADHLHAEHDAMVDRIKSASPVLGRIRLVVNPLPDRGNSWEKGAIGEEKFGATLEELSRATDGKVLVLHDRRIPGSKGNIDHIVVAPTGIWVIDAKRYKGRRIAHVDRGGWLKSDIRLTVGGKQSSKEVDGMHKQIGHIATALASTPFEDLPTHGALCFIEADWPLLSKPFAVRGILVSWGQKLRERLVEDGPVEEATRTALHRHLATSFPPAG